MMFLGFNVAVQRSVFPEHETLSCSPEDDGDEFSPPDLPLAARLVMLQTKREQTFLPRREASTARFIPPGNNTSPLLFAIIPPPF